MNINANIFRKNSHYRSCLICVICVSLKSMTACALVEGWQGKIHTAISCTNWLSGWTYIPQYLKQERRLWQNVWMASQLAFFNWFETKFWLAKRKSLPVIQKVIFCRPYIVCTTKSFVFSMWKTFVVQTFSVISWWGERGKAYKWAEVGEQGFVWCAEAKFLLNSSIQLTCDLMWPIQHTHDSPLLNTLNFVQNVV